MSTESRLVDRLLKDPRTFDTFVIAKVCTRNLNSCKFCAVFFPNAKLPSLFSNAKWLWWGAGYRSRGGRPMIDILGRDVILPVTVGGACWIIRKWPLAERNKPDLCRYCHCFMINQWRHTALCPGG